MSWGGGPEEIFLSTSLASYLDSNLILVVDNVELVLEDTLYFKCFLLTALFSLLAANAVLEGACERVIVGDLYCDIPLGLYVIRGENVVLIGELDLEKEELPQHMTRVSAAEIKR
ncbi:hypothetical protein MKW94_029653, partial [Papaver nudicaule]|nr:hypothetical protein [Papaver nudicaule]